MIRWRKTTTATTKKNISITQKWTKAMKTISDSDLELIIRIFAIVREPLKNHPDRKVINAIRRAQLLTEKFKRKHEKEKSKNTDSQAR